MRIAVGCDHAGFPLKARAIAELERLGHDVLDLGTDSTEAVDYPDFAQAVAAPAWTASGSRQLGMRNVNRFLSSYPDADGVKTGFTADAGRTLVASATRDGRRLYVVLLDAPNRFTDAAALLDWAFANHVWPGC